MNKIAIKMGKNFFPNAINYRETRYTRRSIVTKLSVENASNKCQRSDFASRIIIRKLTEYASLVNLQQALKDLISAICASVTCPWKIA